MDIEIYDCTLREGEQAGGVSFAIEKRIEIAKMLDKFGIEFIELGWPIHQEVLEAFLKIKKENLKAKIVAFGSTSIAKNPEQDKNLNSIIKSKAKYACIFGKTWIEHIEKQLKISRQENLNKISKSIKFLKNKNIEVFYDAEHYFDGFQSDKDYALETIEKAAKAGASRIILCDTNGGILPDELKEILEKTKEFIKNKKIKVKLGVHLHNDSGLALANSLLSLEYVPHIQGTINGLGERVGNLDLCEFIPLLMLKKDIKFNFKLNKLKSLSDFIYNAANLPKKIGQAFISERAFSHKGGVHIDGTSKGASYMHITPEILGLNHSFVLTSLGGSSCVINAAKKLGYSVDKTQDKEKIEKILIYLRELEREGYDLGNIEAEQSIIINSYFGNFKEFFKIKKWRVTTGEENSRCYIKIKFPDKEVETETEIKGGPVDVIYKTLKNALLEKYKGLENLKLKDYKVRIANPEGVESSVRTKINFSDGEEFSTVGVSKNIIGSSLEAIEKAFNYYLNTFSQDLKTKKYNK